MLVTHHTTYIVLLYTLLGARSPVPVTYLCLLTTTTGRKSYVRKVLVLCKNKLPDPVVQYLLYRAESSEEKAQVGRNKKIAS